MLFQFSTAIVDQNVIAQDNTAIYNEKVTKEWFECKCIVIIDKPANIPFENMCYSFFFLNESISKVSLQKGIV